MKASELIKELQKQILKYGDLEFMRYDPIDCIYLGITMLEIHTLENPTPDDEDAEIDVFVLE